jgi:two-component system, NarL family, sensor histidine kinase BarA
VIALIVDDDAPNRDLLKRMLSRLGWLSDSASCCAEACDACRRAHYDYVLLDICMPGTDGYACAKAITAVYAQEERSSGSPAHKPVFIAVSGADGLSGDGRSVFDRFLQKPYGLAELKAILS